VPTPERAWASEPQLVYDRLRREIRAYSEALFHKPHVVLLSKRDLLPEHDPLPVLETPGALGALAFSSVARSGLEDLQEYLWKTVERVKQEEAQAAEAEGSGVEEPWP
jgi:GTPase involved in cell partitioning and DNA repair